MTEEYQRQDGNEELWHTVFAVGHPDLLKQHRLHRMLPRDPRCRMCKVPFGGIGGWIMKYRGKAPSPRNPHYCTACDGFLDAFPGGAEVPMSILFADIRHSTEFAAAAAPAEVGARINRFLDLSTAAIAEHDGFVMAFYGDCVVAVWPPGFSGKDHAAKALRAARALTGLDGQGIPVGIGLHAGPVYIGTVDATHGTLRDISVFGLNVNIAARLASAAQAGEALASAAVLSEAGEPAGETAGLELKGIPDPVPARRL